MSRETFRRPDPEDNLSLANLEARIPRAEQDHARLRTANRIIRNRKLGDEEKIARLVSECHIHPDDAPGLLKPNQAGQVGFRLSGYAASILRMKRLHQMLEAERSRPSIAFSFPGGTVEDSAEHGRVSVFLSQAYQPERVRTLLARGFVFEPARKCYCRWRGEAARYVITQVCNIAWPAHDVATLHASNRTEAARVVFRP